MDLDSDKPMVGRCSLLHTRDSRPGLMSIIRMQNRLFLAIIMLFGQVTDAAELRRIVVQEANNYRLSRTYERMLLPRNLDGSEHVALRRYAGLKPGTRLRDELENIMTVVAWVHKRWQHDPFGVAPPQARSLEILHAAERGEKFSCAEYSKVLRDVLRAYGYISRRATLQSPGIAYGGLGTAHVAVEVYSSQLDKWIFLDPQWGMYLEYQKQAVSIHEYYRLKMQGKEREIIFRPVRAGLHENFQKESSEYREFLNRHLGYLSVDLLSDQERVHVLLALQGKSWPLTFQGLPRNAQIFSDDPQDIYFDVNRVSLVMNYRIESQSLSKANIEFSSEQDYLNKMPTFAAVPDFVITPHHNMPWFSYFEFRIDRGKWTRLREEVLRWRLRPGKNRLEVRAVNVQERRGGITFIQIGYGGNMNKQVGSIAIPAK